MSAPPSPTNTELATFKVFSNTDYVDLGKLVREPPNDFGAALERRMSVGSSVSQAFAPRVEERSAAPMADLPEEDESRPFEVLTPPRHVEELDPFSAALRDTPRHTPKQTPRQTQRETPPRETPPRQAQRQTPPSESPHSSPPRPLQSSSWEGEAEVPGEPARSVFEDPQVRSQRARAAFSPPPRHAEVDDNAPEVLAEKEALLGELKSMEKLGTARLAREFTLNDSLQALQFEYERIQSDQSATQTVEMAKGGIRMGVGVLEMLMKKYGLSAVDGWYNQACGDMGKYNRPLHKLYKKYWRRAPSSPITEIAYLILGSAAWTVVQNKVLGGGGSSSGQASPAAAQPAPKASGVQASYEAPSAGPPPRPMRPPQHASVAANNWGAVAALPSTAQASQQAAQAPSQAAAQAAQAAAQADSLAASLASESAKLKQERDALSVTLASESAKLKQERDMLAAERAELQAKERQMMESLAARMQKLEELAQKATSRGLAPEITQTSSDEEPERAAKTLLLGGSTRKKSTSTAARRSGFSTVLKV